MSKGFKIAINNGGGDAPGLNAVAEGVVLAAHNRGWEVYGIKNSYQGLLDTDEIFPLTHEKVWRISSMSGELRGQRYAIVVAAEGAKPVGGRAISRGSGEVGRQDVILGGVAEFVAKELAKKTGKDARHLVLGHLQRGGSPTTFDRLLCLRFGAAAVRLAAEGKFGHMVALASPEIKAVPLDQVIGKSKNVPLDSDVIQTARDIGISFGD